MAKKTVTYKEPAGYFSEGMRKAAEEWEKKNGGKQGNKPKGSGAKKPATKKK